jgi:hypothetical protein
MVHRHYSIAFAAVGIALSLSTNMARADTISYFGRWTVSDDKPEFSSKGVIYKNVDIAPCGADFCGVSVDDKNHCGETLFRFFTAHAKDDELIGHGVWGKIKKKLQINYATPQDEKPFVTLGLGDDDMDVTGREGSIPTFQANYKNIGAVSCVAK